VEDVTGPEIVLTTRGKVRVQRADETTLLQPGGSAFLPSSGGDYSLSGPGTAFRARVNL